MRNVALVAIALACAALPAQNLRHAVRSADVVAVASKKATDEVGDSWLLHHLEPSQFLRGDAKKTLSVVEPRGVTLHQRPNDDARRLYCLHDYTEQAVKAGFPEANGPYFKISGHHGSNPRIDTDDAHALQLAQLLIDSEEGMGPIEANTQLLDLALFGPEGIRTEAVQVIAERPVLVDALRPLEISKLVSRAVGETDDIPFKIALASVCAERGTEGLVDALCLSLEQVDDARFARALGRIARRLHGEKALDVFRPHLARPGRKGTRGRLLLALGATSTESALEALLEVRQREGSSSAVDAALRAHGSPRAIRAVDGK